MTPGTLIANRYEIISLLGRGGMGAVYQAIDKKINRVMAIKVLGTKYLDDKISIERFKREAMAAASLSHPHLTGVYDCGLLPDGSPFLVMEFLSGEALSDLIERRGHLSCESVIRILTQVSRALGYAHSNNMIHRDLKPSNIMLLNQSEDEFVKVVDFGLIYYITPEGQQAAKLTGTGEVLGSPLYMSPEQCRGRELDGRTDIYSLGCMMYEMLSGVAPFEADAVLQVICKHLEERPKPFSTVCPDYKVPPELESICFRCLEKDPAMRFQSMEQLGQALKAAGNGTNLPRFDELETSAPHLIESTTTRQIQASGPSARTEQTQGSALADTYEIEQTKTSSSLGRDFIVASVMIIVGLAGLSFFHSRNAGNQIAAVTQQRPDSESKVTSGTSDADTSLSPSGNKNAVLAPTSSKKNDSIASREESHRTPEEKPSEFDKVQDLIDHKKYAGAHSSKAVQRAIPKSEAVSSGNSALPKPPIESALPSKPSKPHQDFADSVPSTQDKPAQQLTKEGGEPPDETEALQDKNSLEKRLAAAEASGKLENICPLLDELAGLCEHLEDHHSEEKYARELFELVQSHPQASASQQISAYYRFAWAEKNNNHEDAVEPLAKKAIDLQERFDNAKGFEYGRSLSLLAQTYQSQKRHSESAPLFHKAADVFDHCDHPKTALQAYARAAFNYRHCKEWQRCIDEGEAALKYSETHKITTSYVGKILGDIAEAFDGIHDREKALSYAKKATDFWQSHSKLQDSAREYKRMMALTNKIQPN